LTRRIDGLLEGSNLQGTTPSPRRDVSATSSEILRLMEDAIDHFATACEDVVPGCVSFEAIASPNSLPR
jgi:hypothetical protein